jgi:hypothetical protein
MVVDREGVLKAFDATGHAEWDGKGMDIVCAAFTVLVRTAARVLEADEGVTLEGGAREPGTIGFTVDGYVAARLPWILGVQDVLRKGVQDLSEEYPEHCGITVVVADEE